MVDLQKKKRCSFKPLGQGENSDISVSLFDVRVCERKTETERNRKREIEIES